MYKDIGAFSQEYFTPSSEIDGKLEGIIDSVPFWHPTIISALKIIHSTHKKIARISEEEEKNIDELRKVNYQQIKNNQEIGKRERERKKGRKLTLRERKGVEEKIHSDKQLIYKNTNKQIANLIQETKKTFKTKVKKTQIPELQWNLEDLANAFKIEAMQRERVMVNMASSILKSTVTEARGLKKKDLVDKYFGHNSKFKDFYTQFDHEVKIIYEIDGELVSSGPHKITPKTIKELKNNGVEQYEIPYISSMNLKLEYLKLDKHDPKKLYSVKNIYKPKQKDLIKALGKKGLTNVEFQFGTKSNQKLFMKSFLYTIGAILNRVSDGNRGQVIADQDNNAIGKIFKEDLVGELFYGKNSRPLDNSKKITQGIKMPRTIKVENMSFFSQKSQEKQFHTIYPLEFRFLSEKDYVTWESLGDHPIYDSSRLVQTILGIPENGLKEYGANKTKIREEDAEKVHRRATHYLSLLTNLFETIGIISTEGLFNYNQRTIQAAKEYIQNPMFKTNYKKLVQATKKERKAFSKKYFGI